MHDTLRRLVPLAAGTLLVLATTLAATPTTPAHAAPAALSAPFPRVGTWWPAGPVPASTLARYDLAVLHDYELDRATALRVLRPDAVILDTTAASEIIYDPEDAARNVDLRSIPAQWLLTQVGSRLSSPVRASDTAFKVEAVALQDGTQLFKAGDAVVVDDEVARVESVAGTTLTVRRGAVKTPASHAAGTRVAAAISRWHDRLVTDISTTCPRLTAPGGPGPETWGEYDARVGAKLVSSGPWDGLFIDRGDGYPSWMVVNGKARTIDVDRSNRVPASYAAFDAAWNAGVFEYESRLRAAVGPTRLLVSNWGLPNFGLLNGSNFEAFPADGDGHSYNSTWQQTVFGPMRGAGGYLEWLSSSRRPPVSMISNYRLDDGGSSGGEPAPITLTDVRKARFGLATALLGDGFYSYTLNDGGISASRLAWFDLYDGGGLGRGYLGQPAGESRHAQPPLGTPDMLTLGDFSTPAELAGWPLWVRSGYAGDVSLDSGAGSPAGGAAAHVNLTQVAGTDWEARLTRGGVTPVSSGAEYTVAFWAKADRTRTMGVWVQGDGPDTRTLMDFGDVALDTTWRRYELPAKATASSGSSGTRLHFAMGTSAGHVWLDGVRMQQGSTAVWRRDYSGGTVVVNASATEQVVDLGGTFRAFSGSQDPTVDDGRTVTSVVVPPLSARILVRSPALAAPDLGRARLLLAHAADYAEAERLRDTEALASARGVRKTRLASAAAGWQRARDACGVALIACLQAQASAGVGDGPASRLLLDTALSATGEARAATHVRDARTRHGVDAASAAQAAALAVESAHGVLP